VAQVVKLMADAGARVNKSCGFHVHVNARDISGASIANIVRRYARHEAAIDGFMVHSRRGSNNSYCRSTDAIVSRFSTVAVNATAESMASIANRENYDDVTGRYAGGRYHKINLCAFLRHGTVEFRHHGGTMSPSKVINWIAFCVTFFETSLASDTEELFAGMDPSMVAFFNERAVALAAPPVVRPMRRR
jgi:cytochrome c551/c552